MKFDLHTHHQRCGHAQGTIQDYIEAALKEGLAIIGISEHAPYFGAATDHPQPELVMAKPEFPQYIAEVLRLKQHYQDRIEVLLGVEADYIPGEERFYRQFLAKYQLDYVIGSLHISGGTHMVERVWEELPPALLHREQEAYYQLIQQAACSGLFNFIGHFDVLKKALPGFEAVPPLLVDQTLQVIADQDLALEVNTSGKWSNCEEWFPGPEILERVCYYGIKVTFGSDAHQPETVGRDYTAVQQRLRAIGFKDWAIFRQRQRVLIPL